jgi:signal transduction histidine kinase
VDAWAESQRRMQEVEQRAGLDEGVLLGSLSDSADPVVVISPQGVEQLQEVLREAATQLSNLAASTYETEKGRIVDWIRNQIASSLAPLSAADVDTAEVWKRLSLGLEDVIRYFELSYLLILSWEEGIRVLCQSGLSEADFPMGERRPATVASLSTLRSSVCESKEPAPMVLRDYKNLPFFDQLHRLHRKSKQALAVSIPAPLGSAASVMIMGRFKRDTELSIFSPDDREALMRIVEGITLVIETVLLVEQLEEVARKQALFLEDVAHDIRTPIQNIIVEAALLTRELTSPKETNRLAKWLASQVRRLHLMSERVWMLVNMDRGVLEPDEAQSVSVYQTLMEHRKSLLDLAARREIEILVDQELEGWRSIRVNKTLFSQAVLNLIDNAIKYSRKGTEIRIDGKRLTDGVTLSFVNRGIPIREEDKDRIFERYYRTKEAQMHIREGTGIGLFIVKAFVDYCGGSIEVKSVPIHGRRDYVTEFKMFIPHRGW